MRAFHHLIRWRCLSVGVAGCSRTPLLAFRRCFVRGRVVQHDDAYFGLVEALDIPAIRASMRQAPAKIPEGVSESDAFLQHKKDGLIAAGSVLGVLVDSGDAIDSATRDAVAEILDMAHCELAAMKKEQPELCEAEEWREWIEHYNELARRFAKTGDARAQKF